MHLIPFLSVISGGDLGSMLIEIVVAGLIFWLVWWFVTWVGIPQPFLKVIQVIIGLFALIFLINILLGISGHGHQFIAW